MYASRYFSGMFTKLGRVTISFVTSVRPSVCMEQLGSHCMNFHEIWYLNIFWKCWKNSSFIKIKNDGYSKWRALNIFLSYFAQFCLEWEMFQVKFVEEIKTHFLCSITFFFKKSCYLWDNVEKCCIVGWATDDIMVHSRCMLDTRVYKYTHTQVV